MATAAWAGPLLRDSPSTCSTTNCGTVTLSGQARPLDPFVIQVFAAKDECLRLDVTSASDNLAMSVTSPDPKLTYFNDDDLADSSTTPLVAIDPVPVAGWHTVHINRRNGLSGTVDFQLRYGRYPSGNANCSNPTAPL